MVDGSSTRWRFNETVRFNVVKSVAAEHLEMRFRVTMFHDACLSLQWFLSRKRRRLLQGFGYLVAY